jgi:hypothetical protein
MPEYFCADFAECPGVFIATLNVEAHDVFGTQPRPGPENG